MSTKEKWIEVAKRELGGKDPMKSLSRNWNELEIHPYYDHSDLSFNTKRTISRNASRFGGPNHWYNLPLIDVAAINDGNSSALEHLQSGADGVFFKISPQSEVEKLLTGIKPEFCFLGFETLGKPIQFFEKLELTIPASQLNGVIFWSEPANWLSVSNLFKGYNSFRCLGIVENGQGIIDQVFNNISEAFKIVDLLTDYAFSPKNIFSQIAFSVSASKDFFGDVVKVRSLRVLMNRLAQGYGLEDSNTFIRVKVEPADLESYQPHGDMLFNSFASIAAIVSSADALTVTSANSQSSLHNRTARNISLLLKEESRLDKVNDPFAGSYFIESLTNQIVEKIWEKVIQS